MNVLVITCSAQQQKSSSYNLAQTMLKQLASINTIEVEYFDATRLPHIDSLYADAVCTGQQPHDTNQGSLALSDRLIASLEFADVVIIASPMHNYFLPSSLKSWIDHIVRAGKTFEITATGKQALLNDKPVYILISSGGFFLNANATQPDFFTPYMKEVLGTIGLKNMHFFALEGTALSHNLVQPQIDKLKREICEHLVTHFS
ncbi:FMN-dependent NADH-azoreductase [Colwellia sp. MB3u-4]|uniref:FMN-dependent NADH-azoreductase n=1 Tax=Colwellia sp. MB3u-4 TaxID=2759822 RepID=UPI0015F4D320|nr:NAD(P)H-dependent oxidoreductase [Colwellia sp. MB3u-4]MBA6287404.1 NAD(P)H-dependent oxidoreductase [Colwellia sp. MB3u-4]